MCIRDSNRGVAYRRASDKEKALADFAQAIEITPDYREAYNNRGMVLADNYEYEAAITEFTKAIEIDSDYWYAYNNRAMSKWALGDRKGAESDYKVVSKYMSG